MRPSIVHSVALGLAGLRVAEASVCKPRPSSSDFSSIASTALVVSETTGSGFVSESSTISSIIASAVTTGVDTTTTDAAAEPTTTVISASTEITSTAESTIITQITASTEIGPIDTTTAPTIIETTTTTADLPVITAFQLKGSRDPVENNLVYSNREMYSQLLFSDDEPNYSPAIFSIEASTGHLLIDNSLLICASFYPNSGIATLVLCNDIPTFAKIPITCTPPVKDGDVLKCSVPGLSCVVDFRDIECARSGEILTDTSTDYSYSINQNFAVIGQISNGVGFVVHAV